jgi:hypothetical protein
VKPPEAGAHPLPQAPYTAVKFYFNECFPATPENRAFAHGIVRDLVGRGPVVSLTTNLRLDDHDGHELRGAGVQLLPDHLDPRENLAVQSAIVAGARAFVGTYGGFSYLAPFAGVPTTAYYSNAAGFSPRHLLMAQSAFTSIGEPGLLDVRAAAHRSPLTTHHLRTTTND